MIDEQIEKVNFLEQKPIYSIVPLKKRVIIPKIIILFLLGIIFYLGILLNISLLNLSNNNISTIKIFSIIIITSLVVLGIVLAVLRANKNYQFYNNKISFGNKFILYNNISNTINTTNFFDKIFGTYSIKLNNKFSLENVPIDINPLELSNYLKKLINYSFSLQRR